MAPRLSLFKRLRAARFAALAMALMVAQAIVPNGFMPVFAKGGPTIMLCTGQGMGLQAAALPYNASPAMIAIADAMDDEAQPETGTGPCDYAAASNPISVPAIIQQMPVPALHRDMPFPAAGLAAIGTGLAAPPPPQTGPPTSF